MSILSDIRSAFYNLAHLGEILANSTYQKRMEEAAVRRDYYHGEHRRQFKVKPLQPDDNLTVNFAGLIVRRGVSMLLGEGIEFDLPGDPEEIENPETGEVEVIEQPNQQYIDDMWDANRKDVLMHKVTQFGAINGTCYFKIMLDGVESRQDENVLLPRLIALDPLYMEIETDPEDIDTVIAYINRFNIIMNGKDTARKEVTRRNYAAITNEAGLIIGTGETDSWTIENWYANADTQGQWVRLYADQLWEYEFPPIIHWQNLPLAGSCYGEPDITDDVIEIQDRLNFIAANISRIIRYHGHPKTWGRGGFMTDKASWGADEMLMLSGDNAMLQNLEMASDLASSQSFLAFLRQSLFDIARTTDLGSIKDKLGALTNFALRVLFFDSMAKLGSKQELYGEALRELNHRLLVLAGFSGPEADGGEVVWPDPLPTSEAEETQALEFDLRNELTSRETASTMRGYDWVEESGRIDKEREAAREAQGSLGSFFLKQFERGEGGGERMMTGRQAQGMMEER